MGERTIQIMILDKQAMSVAAGTSGGERFCFVLFCLIGMIIERREVSGVMFLIDTEGIDSSA